MEEKSRNSARRFREEEKENQILTPVGIAIMAAVALVAVGMVLLCATGVICAPQTQPPVTSSEPPVASLPEESDSEISSAPVVSLENDPNVPYQSLFPELAKIAPEFSPREEGDKVTYLTFNDVPGGQTDAILQVLQEKGVQATFFVYASGMTDEEFKTAVQKIHAAGHSIGLYGYSGDFDKVYSSVANYLEDFARCDALVAEATGEHVQIFRFPGGSGENLFTGEIGEAVADEMLRRGYVYHDWNVDADWNSVADAAAACAANEKNVVLLDGAGSDAAEKAAALIDALKEDGFRFAPLDATVKPFRFY